MDNSIGEVGEAVTSVSCGAQHTAIITSSHRLFLWPTSGMQLADEEQLTPNLQENSTVTSPLASEPGNFNNWNRNEADSNVPNPSIAKSTVRAYPEAVEISGSLLQCNDMQPSQVNPS